MLLCVFVAVVVGIQTINIHFIHYRFLICLYVGLSLPCRFVYLKMLQLIASAVTCRDGGDGDAVAGAQMAVLPVGAASASGDLRTRPSDARHGGGDDGDGALLLLLPLLEHLAQQKRGL